MPAARKRRVGRPRSKSAPPVLNPKRAPKRKQWTDKAMVAALEAVRGGEPILRVAKMHGIPRSTLQDRIHGRVVHGAKPGPKPYLAADEEEELSMFIVDVAKAGYGKTRKQIKDIVEHVATEKGTLRSGKVSDGWFRRFMERHPKLSLRKGDATANVRMESLDPETIKQYFDLLKDALVELGLVNSPAQLYNVDETGMPLDHRPPKIVTKRGQKKVRCRTSGNKSQITVIGCVSAAGQAIPPFVIFDAKSLNTEWTDGEVSGTSYGLSDKGWVDSELFCGWLVGHFLQYAVAARPLFLLLDGHSSHYQPDLIRFAKDHNIILFCLPPHTTHESQPLDTAVFGPLKRNWQSACHEYMQSNPGKVVTKYQFSALLNKAWMLTMTPSNICSGFRRCGVYPFNPNAIDCSLTSSSSTGGECGKNKVTVGDDGGAEEDILEGGNEFSADKDLLFQKRYEEGYDLFDPEYVRWLEVHHPSDVPRDRHHLVSTSPSTTKSAVDSFTSVVPSLPLTSPPFPGDVLTVASEFPHTPSGDESSHTPPSVDGWSHMHPSRAGWSHTPLLELDGPTYPFVQLDRPTHPLGGSAYSPSGAGLSPTHSSGAGLSPTHSSGAGLYHTHSSGAGLSPTYSSGAGLYHTHSSGAGLSATPHSGAESSNR